LAQRGHHRKQAERHVVHGGLHLGFGGGGAVVGLVRVGDGQREQIPFQHDVVQILVVNRRNVVQASGLDDEPRKLLHQLPVEARDQIDVEPSVQILGTVPGNSHQVFLRGTAKVHGRHVGNHLAVRVQGQVQGDAPSTELLDIHQGRNDPLARAVVHQHLPAVVTGSRRRQLVVLAVSGRGIIVTGASSSRGGVKDRRRLVVKGQHPVHGPELRRLERERRRRR
jgi:hypothetical protein